MVVELRKRKVPAQPPVLEKKPKTAPKSGRVTKSKAPSVKKADVASSKTATPSLTAVPTAGETIDVNGFGGEIENNDGEKTSLKDLLDASEAGVVLFTYPRASTPGCKFIFPLLFEGIAHMDPFSLRVLYIEELSLHGFMFAGIISKKARFAYLLYPTTHNLPLCIFSQAKSL